VDRGPTAEQLLADAGWLRRLAERLAGNGEADDLVQETWIAAWRREHEADRSLRPWLAKVMRDTFRMRRRAERRRQAREARLDEPDAVVSPAEVLEQVRLHKLLVELVLAMDEPFRSTLLSRFVEGKTATEIARASGLPEGTVRQAPRATRRDQRQRATRADAARLTGERNYDLVATRLAPDAGEAMREDAALEVRGELALDVTWQPAAVRIGVAQLSEHGLCVLRDELVQYRSLGCPTTIAGKRPSGRARCAFVESAHEHARAY
jgi:RNA polymerase sigma factor (sigma-70 family)